MMTAEMRDQHSRSALVSGQEANSMNSQQKKAKQIIAQARKSSASNTGL
jgi:hypothetical protein